MTKSMSDEPIKLKISNMSENKKIQRCIQLMKRIDRLTDDEFSEWVVLVPMIETIGKLIPPEPYGCKKWRFGRKAAAA